MSDVSDLKDEVADLRREVERLNARLNVALELLGSCKMSGYPENAGVVQQRLDEALATEHATAAPDESTGKIRAVAPVSAAPSRTSSPSARTQGVDAPGEAGSKVQWEPAAPTEAPSFGHGKQRYDDTTEKDRKLGQALDVLDTLGKIKK